MTNELQQFLQIGIVGTALSFLVQYIKNKFGTDSDTTRIITVALSIALGASYWLLVDTSIWLPVVGILGSATTIYSLFIRK